MARTNLDVGHYYDQQLADAEATGAGLIWFMGGDHLSPPLSNDDNYALHSSQWREASSKRVISLAERMGISAGQLAVELGCGIGGPGRDVAQKTGAQVLGISISHAQLVNLRRISHESGSSYTDVIAADMQDIPLKDCSVDAVYSINAIYHAGEPEKVIGEAERVLRPNGVFGVDDWFTTDATTLQEHQKLRHNWSTSANGFHNIMNFTQNMRTAGFKIREVVDYTEEAGEFLTEQRFGATYDSQIAEVLLDAFPRLYQYDGYQPEHAEMAVTQLRTDILYMGELYRSGSAVYQQIIGQKPKQ